MNQSEQREQLQRLLKSKEGQRLMSLLSGDGGTALEQAGQALRRGDRQAIKSILGPMVENREVQRLLASLEKQMGDG